MTWLQIVIEGPKGGGFPHAVVSIQDDKQMGKILTDRNGIAKV